MYSARKDLFLPSEHPAVDYYLDLESSALRVWKRFVVQDSNIQTYEMNFGDRILSFESLEKVRGPITPIFKPMR